MKIEKCILDEVTLDNEACWHLITYRKLSIHSGLETEDVFSNSSHHNQLVAKKNILLITHSFPITFTSSTTSMLTLMRNIHVLWFRAQLPYLNEVSLGPVSNQALCFRI